MTPAELELNDISCELPALGLRQASRMPAISNPELEPSCAIDVVLIVDESGSMEGKETEVRNALNAILDGFNNTGTTMAIVGFSSSAHVEVGYTTVDDVSTGSGGVLANYVSGYGTGGWTNWDDALHKAHGLSPADGTTELTLIITDGNPNRYEDHTHSGYSGYPSGTAIGEAVNEANFIKDQGTHMFAVGVGNQISETNIRKITGNARFPGSSTFGASDYMIETDFSQLESSLRAAVYAQCAPQVIINKRLDLDGDGTYETDTGSEVSGFEFTGTTSNATATVDWTRPDVPNDTSPVSGTTDNSGSVQFEWRFGSEANPQPGSLTMSVVEGPRAGYTYHGAECTTKKLLSDGSIELTTDQFSSSEAMSFAVSQSSIVTCEAYNRAQTVVVLEKEWVDSVTGDSALLTIAESTTSSSDTSIAPDAPSVDLTDPDVDPTDPTMLDPDNSAELVVATGASVTLSEALSATSLYDRVLTCDQGSLDYVAGETTGILDTTGLAGETVTCTFTNSGRSAQIDLKKHWVNGVNGDTFTLNLDGNTQGVTSTGAADETQNGPSASALPGDTIVISETASGTNAVDYTSTLACDGATNTPQPVVGQAGKWMLEIATTDAGQHIECTLTNTREPIQVTLRKAWVNGIENDTAALTITGAASTPPGGSTSTVPVGQPNYVDTTNVVTAEVAAGGQLVLKEVLGSSNTGRYEVDSFTCIDEQGNPIPDDQYAHAAGARVAKVRPTGPASNITCTFTNTSQRGKIVVNKLVEGADGTFSFTGAWQSPANFDITTTGGAGSATFDGVVVPADPDSRYTLVEADPTPGYDGTVLTCSSDQPYNQTTTDLATLTASIQVRDGETVTCTYTNTERAVIKIIKDARPDDAQDFSFTMSGDAAASFTLDDDPASATPNEWTSPRLAANRAGSPHTYTITETAVAGWTIDTAASRCDSSDGTVNANGTITVTPSPGTMTTCTVVNKAAESGVSVAKSVTGVAADYAWGPFTVKIVDSNGVTVGSPVDLSGTGPTTVTSPTTITGLQLNQIYTFIEDPPTNGWTNSGLACSTATSVLTDLDPAAPGFQFEVTDPDMSFVCTAANESSDGSIKVTKTVRNHTGDWSFDFTLADDDPATADQVFTLDQDNTGYEFSQLETGAEYTLTETVPDGWTSAMWCTVTSADGSSASSTGPWTIQPGDRIRCCVRNTRNLIPVAVAKHWNDPASTDDATLTASGAESAANIDFSVYDGHDGTSGTTMFWSGETVSLAETFPAGNVAAYGTSLECRAATSTSVGDPVGVLSFTAGALTGELALPATLPDGYDHVLCTWTNTRDLNTVSLTKRWIDAPQGDQADIELSIDASNTHSTTSTADGTPVFVDTGHAVSTLVGGGDTISLSEELNADNSASYTTTWSCSSPGWPADVTGTGTSGQFVMPASDAVSCVITNTAVTTTLHIDKVWVNAVAGDTADITVSGTKRPVAPATATADADNVAAPGETDPDVLTITVTSGEADISVSEVINSTTATYTQVLSCTGVDDLDPDAGTFTIPTNPTVEPRCTLTNTAQRGTIIINKLVDGAGGDFTFDGDWADSSGNAVGQFVLSPPDAGTDTEMWTDVLVGSYQVVETDAPDYDQTLNCSEMGRGVDHGSWTSGMTGHIDLDDGETVTCTYTNTERAALIVIEDSQPDDDQVFDYTLQSLLERSTYSARSLFITFSLVDQPASPPTNTWSTTLSPHIKYRLIQNYVPNWDLTSVGCDAPTQVVQDATSQGIDIRPDAGQTITCLFVNKAGESGLTVTKSVENVTPDLEWSFKLALTPDPSGSSPVTVSGVGESSTTVGFGNLVLNQQYTIEEVPMPGWSASEMTCAYLNEPLSDEDPLVDGYQFTIAEPSSVVTCELTNTADPGEVEVTKKVVAGDDQSWQFSFTIDPVPAGADATQTITGTGASTEVVRWAGLMPGVNYTITEADAGTRWVSDGQGCVVIADDGSAAPLVDDAGDGFAVTPGAHIACDFTNTARGDLSVAKSVAGVTDLGGGKVRIVYTLVVTSDSDMDEPYVVDDTLHFGAGISVVAASVTSSDAVVNPNWNGVTDTAVTDAVQALPPNGTHTFTVTVEALITTGSSAESRNCVLSTGETGTGLLNSARVIYDNGVGEDDACGTPPPPKVPHLPRTGANTVPFTGLGFAAILAGGFMLLLSRRRRQEV